MAFNVPNADLLTGAAGKCNSGGGGDYFQPGMHKVQIVKTDVSPSTNPQESGCQIHIVEGLIVKGGEGTIRYDKDAAGMAIDLAVPRTLPAPAVGRKQASVNKSMPDVTRFQKNLGDFCLAAKQTFMNVVTAADTPEELTKYLTEIRDFKGPSLARVRAFIARGQTSRDVTEPEDIIDVLQLDLPLGMVMGVEVTQYKTKMGRNAGKLSGILKWHPGTAADLSLIPGDDD